MERTPTRTEQKYRPLNYDRRIPTLLSMNLARARGSMPDGWMQSYHKADATVVDLGAPEWDIAGMQRYSARLVEIANHGKEQLTDLPNTPENRIALYGARSALLREAYSYYDPRLKRPGYPLFYMLHWEGHTRSAVDLGRQHGHDNNTLRDVIIQRVAALDTELGTLLHFVREGGWQTPYEKKLVCKKILTLSVADKPKTHTLWKSLGGEDADFDTAWKEVSTITERYHVLFDAIDVAPPQPRGIKNIQEFFTVLGIEDAPEDIIAHCEMEQADLMNFIDRLRNTFPQCTERRTPQNDAEIEEWVRSTRQSIEKQLRGTRAWPEAYQIPRFALSIRPAGSPDAQLAAYSGFDGPHGTMRISSHTEKEQWELAGHIFRNIFAHEFTHALQHEPTNTAVDKGWLGPEAKEGAAVTREWIEHEHASTPHALYQQALFDLRKVLRMKYILLFHTGRASESEIRNRLPIEMVESNEFLIDNMMRAATADISGDSSLYWIGPHFFAAYAEQVHGGKFAPALRVLTRTTGLRLPGHVLIPNIDLEHTHLVPLLPQHHPFTRIGHALIDHWISTATEQDSRSTLQ